MNRTFYKFVFGEKKQQFDVIYIYPKCPHNFINAIVSCVMDKGNRLPSLITSWSKIIENGAISRKSIIILVQMRTINCSTHLNLANKFTHAQSK